MKRRALREGYSVVRMRALMRGCMRRCVVSVATGCLCCCSRSKMDRSKLRPRPESTESSCSTSGRSCLWSPERNKVVRHGAFEIES